MIRERYRPHVVVIGSGFAGLSAAYELTREGVAVTVLEKDDGIGGLAGGFEISDQQLEKFYHHWFNSDEDVIQLVKELGCEDRLLYSPTSTGMYVDNNFFRLSTPFDVLRFKPLGFLDRIRLGLLVLRARRVKDWQQLESLTAEEWLTGLCGSAVYRTVWEPLLRGKFGPFASEVSAVWFWNKLILRGGSRGRTGKEVLLYYRGGFPALAETIVNKIKTAGGAIQTGTPAQALIVENGRVKGVQTPNGTIDAQAVIATPALPIVAELLEPHLPGKYVTGLRKIKYLANACLVLELSHSLSDIYWLNVNDPNFPYVGVIEHSNFQHPETYGGRHIVYLSTYLPETAEMYRMNKEQLLAFSLPHISRIFPKFNRSWVQGYRVCKARYAQPLVVRNYSRLIPSNETPLKGFYIATMAQIYPEDRGTNYAIREGRRIGRIVATQMTSERPIRANGVEISAKDSIK